MPPATPSQQIRPLVAVRVRPPEDTLSAAPSPKGGRHELAYQADHVFYGQQAHNSDIYTALVQPVVDSAYQNCYHGIVFAYGQTSSGKTHTMHGDAIEPQGLIDFAIQDLLSRGPASLRLSCCQIHLDTVTNLLAPNPAEASPAPSPSPSLNRLRSIRATQPGDKHLLTSYEQAAALLRQARQQRTVNATKLNQSSSRSHVVVQLDIEPVVGGGSASLMLVDLAGSEDPRKAGAEQGKVLQEAISINLSLLNLQNVITAWATNPHGHIPHEDSTLTRKLKHCLNPFSRVAMLITIRSEELFQAESIRALEFAKTAMRIVSKPIANKNDDLRRRTEHQLRQQLEALEAECELLRKENAVRLRKAVEDVTAGKRSCRQELVECQRVMHTYKNELHEVSQQAARLETDLKLNQQQSAGLQVQLRAKQARLQELEQLLAVSKCRSDQLEEQFRAAQARELELLGELGVLRASVAGLEHMVRAVQQELEDTQASLALEAKEVAKEFSLKLVAKMSQVDELRVEVLNLTQQLQATRSLQLNTDLTRDKPLLPTICDATTQYSPVKAPADEEPCPEPASPPAPPPVSPRVVSGLQARLGELEEVVLRQQELLDASERDKITWQAEQQAVSQWLDTLEQQLGSAGLQGRPGVGPGVGPGDTSSEDTGAKVASGDGVGEPGGEVQVVGTDGGEPGRDDVGCDVSACVARVMRLSSAVEGFCVDRQSQLAAQSAAQQAALDSVAAELQQCRQELAAAQKQGAEARAQADAAQQQVVEARAQADAAQQQVVEARAQAEAAQQQVVEARAQADAAQQQVVEARAQADAAQQQVVEARAQADAAQQQVVEARAQGEAAQQQTAEARAQAEAAQQQVKDTQGIVQALEQQCSSATTFLTESQHNSSELARQVQVLQHEKSCLQRQVTLYKELCDEQSEVQQVVRQEVQSMEALAAEAYQVFSRVQAVCLGVGLVAHDDVVVGMAQDAAAVAGTPSCKSHAVQLEDLELVPGRCSPDVQHPGDQDSCKSPGPTLKAWDASPANLGAAL